MLSATRVEWLLATLGSYAKKYLSEVSNGASDLNMAKGGWILKILLGTFLSILISVSLMINNCVQSKLAGLFSSKFTSTNSFS